MNVSIFITNLAKYNAGELFGEWVDLPLDDDELEEKMHQIADNGTDCDDELFITDYEAPFKIDEYDSIEKINEKAQRIDDLDEEEQDVLEAYLDDVSDNFDEALRVVENGDYTIYGSCDTVEELAEEFVDNGCYGEVPDGLRFYIDYDAIARDMEMNGTYVESNMGVIEFR